MKYGKYLRESFIFVSDFSCVDHFYHDKFIKFFKTIDPGAKQRVTASLKKRKLRNFTDFIEYRKQLLFLSWFVWFVR